MNFKYVIGYVLLLPSLFSVGLFFAQLTGYRAFSNFLYTSWTGDYYKFGGGYTSALPFYFGLMAIAGAYLIKDSK